MLRYSKDLGRYFLKDHIRQEIDFYNTDQNMGLSPPTIQKKYPSDAESVELPPFDDFDKLQSITLLDAIADRKSTRNFKNDSLEITELSFLLWATQGVRSVLDIGHAKRTVPSAGCRHSFETYLAIINVSGLEQGIYRYLPLQNELLLIKPDRDIAENVTEASLNQRFAGNSSVVFIWSAIPYRMEWRYGLASYKVIAIDVGHVCQNLYLACQAISAGTCAVAAYDQNKMDQLISVDGENEFVIYTSPVGKI